VGVFSFLLLGFRLKHRIQPVLLPNGRFANKQDEKSHNFVMQSVGMYLYGVLNSIFNTNLAPQTCLQPLPKTEGLIIQWLGHASFLIKSSRLTIITDPVLADLTLFFKRLQQAPYTTSDLPSIDAVLLSHNHRDHSDAASLAIICKQNPDVTIHCPIGDGAWLKSLGAKNIREYAWWQEGTLTPYTQERLMFLPTNHWSQRWVFDKNKSLWGSFMLELEGRRIYFGGDSAYGSHYQAINTEFSRIDVALLPIAPCEPHAWLHHSHMNAEQAGRAWLELGAHTMIPMHWGTFRFGIDYPLLAMERMQEWYAALSLDMKTEHILMPLMPGQYIALETMLVENNLYLNTLVQNLQTK
jgi:L-ascorbate metabolism protein UlaG (beta-lactamase superfamily)